MTDRAAARGRPASTPACGREEGKIMREGQKFSGPYASTSSAARDATLKELEETVTNYEIVFEVYGYVRGSGYYYTLWYIVK